jgi:tetratricopeptide (TPR) repeat protein
MAQTTLRDYLQTTEDAISSGRIQVALDNCQNILTHFPESLEAQRLLGEVYLAQGKLEDAQHTFDWVLTNDPENVMAYCNRALISERMSDYDTALDCYQQAYELSRGNSQIRQVFNQLSEKVGQQGFIFSRAGLARLYMRGDLLPQAAQEWDIVLTTTPDRLDARTGLLETYWREGNYDQVEQLAKQILHDIPHCLKALLLIAHVTFAQDALHAQELMRQAEALDPDQIMAHELFSDFIASHPKEPFLKLLRKTPIIFPETSNGKQAVTTTAAALEHSSNESNGKSRMASNPSTFSDPLVKWSSLDNIIEPQQDYQTLQGATPIGSWGGTGSPDFGAWSAIASTNQESELEVWQSLPEIQERDHSTLENEQTGQQPAWYHMDAFTDTTADPWSSASNNNPVTSSASWGIEEQESDLPAPPAWLDMLTKGNHRQSSGPMPQVPPSAPAQAQEIATVQQPVASTPLPAIHVPQEEQYHFASSSSQATQEEEEFFFGPEWLKSLGATTMDPLNPQEPEIAPSAEPTPSESSVPAAVPEAVASWTIPATVAESQTVAETAPPQSEAKQTITVENWLEQAAQKLNQPEQNVLATLEELEDDLRAQGFTPLEPGTLSALAIEPTLSSALAQFGNFAAQPTTGENPVQPTTTTPPIELLWSDTAEPISQTATDATASAPTHLDALTSLANARVEAQPTSSGVTPEPAGIDQLPGAVAGKAPSNMQPAPTTQPTSPFDFELETTMKRPAVSMQPTQKRPSVQLPRQPRQPHQHQASSRNRTGELASAHQAGGNAPSNKERLLKGYQYQLGGLYDEAMQEYRIIIRNAPELLGEVVSNMRALLKIAPKYSAGYRVLGDAYMRLGEYLQAMEAYNKALNMAKKAKS